METHRVQCVVSPANAFGLMDGGYDLEIIEWFGDPLQKRVQQYIIDHFYGEQPVGTSFLIDTGTEDQALIHTPAWRLRRWGSAPANFCLKSAPIMLENMYTRLMTTLPKQMQKVCAVDKWEKKIIILSRHIK